MSDTPETDAEFANMVEATNSPAAKRIAQLERERDDALSQIVRAECRAERFCQERDEAMAIIRKASVKFCEDGPDGKIAAEMFAILRGTEAK